MSRRELWRLQTELASIVERIGDGKMAAAAEKWPDVGERLKRDEARYAHLVEILAWYEAQTDYVLSHAVQPLYGWGRPRNLFYHLSGRDCALSQTLRRWVRDLLRRGLLSEEHAAGVILTEPRNELLERQRREDHENEKTYQTRLQEIWSAVAEHAKDQGFFRGSAVMQARGIFNKSFSCHRHDDETLDAYIEALVHLHKLLPKLFSLSM